MQERMYAKNCITSPSLLSLVVSRVMTSSPRLPRAPRIGLPYFCCSLLRSYRLSSPWTPTGREWTPSKHYTTTTSPSLLSLVVSRVMTSSPRLPRVPRIGLPYFCCSLLRFRASPLFFLVKWTPLHFCSFYGHIECFEILTSSNADVNAISKVLFFSLFFVRFSYMYNYF